MLDILILGCGPAGLALARQARNRGLDVACMAPQPSAEWSQTLCSWMDELDGIPTRAGWKSIAVRLDEDREHRFDRSYGLIDNRALKALLSAGVPFITESATQLENFSDHSRVNGHRARIVVDATGHVPALARCPKAPPVGWQTAYGLELQVEHGLDTDTGVFMDFSGPGSTATFLYALPLSKDRLFVEETSLIARKPLPFDILRNRLERRLDRRGIPRGRVLAEEKCRFPMGGPLPPSQRVVGFGAAAGMVHPATGYSVGRTLRAADRLATALNPELPPDQASTLAWKAVWPPAARRARALHMVGARVLTELDLSGTRAFFHTFFGLPEPLWVSYLDADVEPIEPMLRFFARAEPDIRRRLLAAGFNALRAA